MRETVPQYEQLTDVTVLWTSRFALQFGQRMMTACKPTPHRTADLPRLREIVIPCGRSGYVALFEIDRCSRPSSTFNFMASVVASTG